LERHREAIPFAERQLALAREAGLAPLAVYLRNAGGVYMKAGDPARALPLLEEAAARGGLGMGTSHAAELRSVLALALLGVGRDADAVAESAEAVALVRQAGADTKVRVLAGQARLEEQTGRPAAALALAREALGVVEELRAKLSPDDFLRRGFGDEH